MTATIELTVGDVTTPVETPIDAVALAVETTRCDVMSRCIGPIARAIETPVDDIATSIETMVDAVTLSIEPLFDTVAAAVQTLIARRVLCEGRLATRNGDRECCYQNSFSHDVLLKQWRKVDQYSQPITRQRGAG
jgi:hypothetical protein